MGDLVLGRGRACMRQINQKPYDELEERLPAGLSPVPPLSPMNLIGPQASHSYLAKATRQVQILAVPSRPSFRPETN